MKIIPSKAQWEAWSLPSKLTAIGTCVGIVGIALSIVFFLIADTGEIVKNQHQENSQNTINVGDRSNVQVGNNNQLTINNSVLAWEEFISPLKENGWEKIIKSYRTTPPAVEKKITYEEAKARSSAAASKRDFYQAIAVAEVALRKRPSDYNLRSTVGEYFVALGDYDEARKAKWMAIESLKSSSMVFGRFANEASLLYLQLGNVNERRGNNEEAMYAYDMARFFAVESENKKVLEDIKAKEAIFNTKENGVTFARKSYIRSLETFGNFSEEVATKANNLALAYQREGEFEGSEKLFEQVINILENLDLDDEIKVAMAYVNLAVLYEGQENYGQADTYFHKMLSKFGPSENITAYNVFFNSLKLSIKKGKRDRALENYSRAKKYLELLPASEKKEKNSNELELIAEKISNLSS